MIAELHCCLRTSGLPVLAVAQVILLKFEAVVAALALSAYVISDRWSELCMLLLCLLLEAIVRRAGDAVAMLDVFLKPASFLDLMGLRWFM